MKLVKILGLICASMMIFSASAKDAPKLKLDTKKGLSVSVDNGKSWKIDPDFDMAERYGSPVLYKVLGVSSHFEENGLFFICTLPAKPIEKEGKFVWRCNYFTKEVKKVIIDNDRNYISEISFTDKSAKREIIFSATAHGAFASYDMGKTWSCLYRTKGIKRVIPSRNFDSDHTIELTDAKGGGFISKDGGKTFEVVNAQ